MGKEGSRDQILIAYGRLLKNIDDPDLSILDMRSPMEYSMGHLPKAQLIPYERIVDFSPGRPYLDVTSQSQIESLLSDKGVSSNSRVVVYGDKGGASAARLFWTLELYGVNVSMLDISFSAWRGLGLSLTREVPTLEKTEFRPSSRPNDFRATSDYIASRLENQDTMLIDTRSAEEFNGLIPSGQRSGRIPGSLNIPWDSGVGSDGKIFRESADLESLFKGRGLTADKEIICYCQVGERASHTFLALRLAGFPKVKIYDRSFSEWGSKLDLPVET